MPTSLRLAPWRRAFQWATAIVVLGIPFLRVGGESFLRIDLASRTLLAAGTALRLEELYLFLLLVVGSVLAFLLVTLVLGRVGCGWACPQTVLSDAVEGFARLLGARVAAGRVETKPWQRSLLYLLCAGLGLLVGANLLWYFISPYDFFPRLIRGDLPGAAWTTLAIVGTVVCLDLAFVRRSFCRTVCPYGRIQASVTDPATLTLQVLPSEAARCIRCEACVRSCPTGIDIRNGYQVECINCGRCRDACATVMARRGEPGLIAYTFGTEDKGPRALLNVRTGVLILAFVAVAGVFVVSSAQRSSLTLNVRRSPAPSRTLESGGAAHFFTAFLSNRGASPLRVSLGAMAGEGIALELRGPVREVEVPAGERRQIEFVLISPPAEERGALPVVIRARSELADGAPGPTAKAKATVELDPKGGGRG